MFGVFGRGWQPIKAQARSKGSGRRDSESERDGDTSHWSSWRTVGQVLEVHGHLFHGGWNCPCWPRPATPTTIFPQVFVRAVIDSRSISATPPEKRYSIKRYNMANKRDSWRVPRDKTRYRTEETHKFSFRYKKKCHRHGFCPLTGTWLVTSSFAQRIRAITSLEMELPNVQI